MSEFKNNILILFAHPALQKSRVNRQLIPYVNNLEGVTFHDLYEVYPDFNIHVKREQDMLAKHDVIIFHHPLFWFSMPAMLKEWMDLVLEHMWAYGAKGRALRGKMIFTVTSTGGRQSLFTEKGYNKHTMYDFLLPLKQSAFVCGMKFLPPFVVHGTHNMTKEKIARHGEDYRRLVLALRDGRVDLEAAAGLTLINNDIDGIIKEEGQ